MDNTTIVATVILVGVFVLMALAIVKSGIDAAVRLWGVMGALTGVAFGGITSYYFTNQSNQNEIQQAQLQSRAAAVALDNASQKAAEANKLVESLAAALKGEKTSSSSPIGARLLARLPESDKAELASKIEQASTQLKDIHALKNMIAIDKKIVPKQNH